MVSGKLPWEAVSTARDVLPLAAAVIPAPVHQECDDPPFDDWGSSEDGNDAVWIKERMTKDFWVNTAVRAARTFVQTVIALNTSNTLWDFGMPWLDLAYTSLGAAGLSVLMSIDRSVKN